MYTIHTRIFVYRKSACVGLHPSFAWCSCCLDRDSCCSMLWCCFRNLGVPPHQLFKRLAINPSWHSTNDSGYDDLRVQNIRLESRLSKCATAKEAVCHSMSYRTRMVTVIIQMRESDSCWMYVYTPCDDSYDDDGM